ncbi:uncharacterized protein LOC141685373 [Apium graveolens]|uniref:uncharacterized protein LOC141685373 n=1 Tax=Apium graveolens TaxID=4045 RepID=UPI003D79F24D
MYDLKPSSRMSVIKNVGIFIFVLAQGASNRHAKERFQHFGEIISRVFHEVVQSVFFFAKNLIKPDNPEFKKIPSHILNDDRYMPHFKDCIGVIDGTHILACVPVDDQDGNELLMMPAAVNTPPLNFPSPPHGKNYLAHWPFERFFSLFGALGTLALHGDWFSLFGVIGTLVLRGIALVYLVL